MNPWVISTAFLIGTSLLTALIIKVFNSGFWRVEKRLKMVNQDEMLAGREFTSGEKNYRFPLFSLLLKNTDRHGTLERMLKQAGINWLPDEYAVAWLAVALVTAAAGWLLLGPFAAVTGIILAFISSWMTLTIRKKKRLSQFQNQLADALMLMSSSLRSGYGFLRSIQALRDEMKPPISVEFAIVLDETAVGLGVPEALRNLVQRVPLPDLDIAVTAILIQLDVGGNLADVIEIVAETVRERQRVSAEVDTLTAEGRLSGIVLFLLPVAMAIILMFLNPTYMSSLLKTNIGHLLIFCAAGLQIIGGIIIKRILEVDF